MYLIDSSNTDLYNSVDILDDLDDYDEELYEFLRKEDRFQERIYNYGKMRKYCDDNSLFLLDKSNLKNFLDFCYNKNKNNSFFFYDKNWVVNYHNHLLYIYHIFNEREIDFKNFCYFIYTNSSKIISDYL